MSIIIKNNMMTVQTKEIMDGRYVVYSDGRVWSNLWKRFLTPKSDKYGYLRVGLYEIKSAKRKHLQIHRLVAQCFIKNPNNFETVNHINEIKNDNRVDNLEWCTIRTNINKYVKNNSKFPGAYPYNKSGRFFSKIYHNGKYIHLGLFNTPEQASAAYQEYRKKHNLK